MCGQCVMESVKERMIGRRSLLAGAAGLAAAGVAGAVAGGAGPASAQPAPTPAATVAASGRVLDMTHELHEAFPTFFGEQQVWIEKKFTWAQHKFNLNEVRANEHTGTHVDAPIHFSENGQTVAEVPIAALVAPLVVIDIRAKAAANPDAQVTPDDIRAWTAANGPLPRGACVAMLSGWDKHVDTPKFRNADDQKKMHFPGFHVEAAQMLIADGNAIGMAVDTLSLDFGPSPDFATHYAWLPTNRWGLECLANLEQVPARGATLFVGAPKLRGGSGGQARVMAVV